MLDKGTSREVRRHTRRIFLSEWDPIGVDDIPEAVDEYDSYIGDVYQLLETAASEADLRAYLGRIEVDRMGLANASGRSLVPELGEVPLRRHLKRCISTSHELDALGSEMRGYTEAMTFRVVLEYDPATRGWSAVCPELPGCTSAGDTEDEARHGIEEAIRLYLAPSDLDLPVDAKVVEVMVG